MTTPEGKIKIWAKAQYERLFPGHWRVSPRGGPFGKSGTMDDVLCWQGQFVGVEVKSDDGDASLLQMTQLRRVQAAGGVAALLRGKDQARLLLVRQLANEPVELLRMAYDALSESAGDDESINLLCVRISACLSRLTSTPGRPT